MRIGIDLPLVDHEGRVLDAPGVMRRAAMVEAAGFDGIWNGDGSYFRGSYTEVDPLAWMLLAVAATERVEVGVAVYQVPLREPVDLAQRLLTLHALARGRFTCGVGSGSTERGAFEAVGVPFADRFRIFHQNMEALRRLLAGEQVGPAIVPPWPEAAGGPRFVLGAYRSETSMRRAAADYDGWMSSAASTGLNLMAEGIRRYRDLGGRRAMAVTCRVDLRAPSTKLDPDAGFNLLCGPEEARDRLGRLAELGYDDVCLRFADHRDPGPSRANFTADDLAEIRSLVERDPRPPYA
jgi:alkanesulfonate monooxygenase SsuD/methylene tetrahydromethanopterin reductase-like flavin-dependent oxidoreductase (luciferase family)